MALNPRTSEELLDKLATDDCAEVRLAVVENINAAKVTLRLLSNDENDDVRYGLAECAHVPHELLLELSRDENPYVRFRALKTLNSFVPHLVVNFCSRGSRPVERLYG